MCLAGKGPLLCAGPKFQASTYDPITILHPSRDGGDRRVSPPRTSLAPWAMGNLAASGGFGAVRNGASGLLNFKRRTPLVWVWKCPRRTTSLCWHPGKGLQSGCNPPQHSRRCGPRVSAFFRRRRFEGPKASRANFLRLRRRRNQVFAVGLPRRQPKSIPCKCLISFR